MRTWVPASRAGGQTGQKEKELRPQVWAEMSPEPCLETSALGPWRGRPCRSSTAVGTPRGGSSPPGTTSCLSSKAPWSLHLYRAGAAGWPELQTCLLSSLSFSSSSRYARQGGDRMSARDAHPASSSWEPQCLGTGGARDPHGERISPSFWWQISHFQG